MILEYLKLVNNAGIIYQRSPVARETTHTALRSALPRRLIGCSLSLTTFFKVAVYISRQSQNYGHNSDHGDTTILLDQYFY